MLETSTNENFPKTSQEDTNNSFEGQEEHDAITIKSLKVLLKSGSTDNGGGGGQITSVRSSPMQSISSIEQQSQQELVVGRNKEYFENLQSCYAPENIAISPSPLTSSR